MNRAERRALGKVGKVVQVRADASMRPPPVDVALEVFRRDLEVANALGVVLDFLREDGERQGGKVESDYALLASMLLPLWHAKRKATIVDHSAFPRMPWEGEDD